MSLRAEVDDFVAAVRHVEYGYRRAVRAPSGELIVPRSGGGGWRDALVRYKFRRKVRRWKASGIRFGRGVVAMPSVFIDTSYGWMIEIGDRTRLAEEVRILCHDAGPQRDLSYGRVGPVTIGRDCVLNERVIVLAGVTIGDNCLIGSGSVVATDIPPGVRAMGVPARVYGTVEDYLAEVRRGLQESPRFGYRELHRIPVAEREQVLARIREAGNRGFHYDPFSQSPFWVTPPAEEGGPEGPVEVGASADPLYSSRV
jgi:acetyltransferase-like isoleucine patch superfamily enzyme